MLTAEVCRLEREEPDEVDPVLRQPRPEPGEPDIPQQLLDLWPPAALHCLLAQRMAQLPAAGDALDLCRRLRGLLRGECTGPATTRGDEIATQPQPQGVGSGLCAMPVAK